MYISNHSIQPFLYFQLLLRSDWDEDCADGLVCWYEDGSGEVPGCSGTPLNGYEYCIDPNAIPLKAITEWGGLDLCEGDW